MYDLLPVYDAPTYVGSVIDIRLPHPRPCLAARCEVPSAAHVIWLAGDNLTVQEVCTGHMAAMKAHAQPCAFAPLDSLPPIHVIAQRVREHMMRMQAAYVRTQAQPMWMNMTGTTNMTFSFYTR